MMGQSAPKGLSFRANLSWTFGGNIATTLSQFSILAILARLGTPAMAGQYGLALAVTAPIFLFAGMSLRNVQVTDIHDDFSFSDYATVRILAMMVALCAVIVIVASLEHTPATAAIILLIALSKVFEGMSDVIFGYFHKHERMNDIAKSLMARAVTTTLVFAAAMWTTGNLIFSTLSMSMVWAFHLVLYDIPTLMRMQGKSLSPTRLLNRAISLLSRIPEHRSILVSLMMLSMPVGISTALISLNTNIPRYILEQTAGASELGIFTVLAYPLAAGTIVISALSQSSLPRMGRYYLSGDLEQFTSLLQKLLLLAIMLGSAALVIAWLIGAETLNILFGAEYAAAETTLIVLVFGMSLGFVNWFLNSALQAMRAFHLMMRIQLAMVPVQIVLALLLVTNWGLIGAAWVIAISMAIQIVAKSLLIYPEIRPITKPELSQ